MKDIQLAELRRNEECSQGHCMGINIFKLPVKSEPISYGPRQSPN